MKESNMPRADFVIGILLLVFGIAITWNSLSMPRYEEQGGTFLDSPGIVPAILGMLIIVFAAILFVRSIIRKGYRLGINGATLLGVLRDVETVRMIVIIALGVFYGLFLLRWIHFIASTAIFVFAFVIIFEYELKKPFAAQWKVPLFAFVMSAGTTAAVYFAFQYLFLVNLP
jgi:hypothetical protein